MFWWSIFLRFLEITQLCSTAPAVVIAALKSTFARHGIPEKVQRDNGPQYASAESAGFARSYLFDPITSSPLFPQSMVQTAKQLLQKSSDPCKALVNY